MSTARRLGRRQRRVLEQLDAEPRTYSNTELAQCMGATPGSVSGAVLSLASRGLLSTWTLGAGRTLTRYVAPKDTPAPKGAVLEVRAKAGSVLDLTHALPVESAPDRSRLVSLGQAQLRSGAEGRVLTSAIAAGELAVYRAPAGPRAKRDAAWLDHLDVDRWAATRQSVARRDEWVAARVVAKGVVYVPAWPLGVEPGGSVEYRIEGDEIRIRRSKTPRTKRRGGRQVPAEVRRDAVRRVVDGGESLSAVARSLGVSHRSVGNWLQAQHGCTLTELRARD